MQRRLLREQAGFSLIEIMVAALVLLVGIFGAFTLLDAANRATASNSARMGATNLARELIEYAHGTDYAQLQPGLLAPALQARPRAAGTGDPWPLVRRRVEYSVTVQACTFDDPKDGLSSTPPSNACPAAAAVAGAPATDRNPDDFRRVTVALTWREAGSTRTMRQSALIVNPTGGRGPRITTFGDPPTQISLGTSFTFTPVNSESATALHWAADDGVSMGDLAGSGTSWPFTWELGPIDAPLVTDGTYTIQAQAFDSRGVPGEARAVTAHVNRRQPLAPTAVSGGFNDQHGGIVDLRWQRNLERDVVGYRVYRVQDGAASAVTSCRDAATDYTTRTSCWDDLDQSLLSSVTYRVVAVDCVDLKAAVCVPRDGDDVEKSFGVPGLEPPPPTNVRAPVVDGVSAGVQDGLPALVWDAPDDPPVPIAFYRIYRDADSDGTLDGLDERYDETITADPRWTDPDPGATTAHRYWVTAVDSDFNESDPSDPDVSPAA